MPGPHHIDQADLELKDMYLQSAKIKTNTTISGLWATHFNITVKSFLIKPNTNEKFVIHFTEKINYIQLITSQKKFYVMHFTEKY